MDGCRQGTEPRRAAAHRLETESRNCESWVPKRVPADQLVVSGPVQRGSREFTFSKTNSWGAQFGPTHRAVQSLCQSQETCVVRTGWVIENTLWWWIPLGFPEESRHCSVGEQQYWRQRFSSTTAEYGDPRWKGSGFVLVPGSTVTAAEYLHTQGLSAVQ